MIVVSPQTLARMRGSLVPLSGAFKLIQGGGPGSGCHGPNCGRPEGSGTAQPAAKTAQGMLKSYGWKKKGEATSVNYKTGQLAPAVVFKHKEHGEILVVPKGGGFTHEGKTYPTGADAKNLASYLAELHGKPGGTQSPTPSQTNAPASGYKPSPSSYSSNKDVKDALGLQDLYTNKAGEVLKWEDYKDPGESGYLNQVTGEWFHPTDISDGLKYGTLTPVADPVAEALSKLGVVEKDPPAGMAKEYVHDSEGKLVWDPIKALYKSEKGATFTPEAVDSSLKSPLGYMKEVKKSGPPEGMPAGMKGPKGGVYLWSDEKQAYMHPAKDEKGEHKYPGYSKEDAAKKLASGKYTPTDESGKAVTSPVKDTTEYPITLPKGENGPGEGKALVYQGNVSGNYYVWNAKTSEYDVYKKTGEKGASYPPHQVGPGTSVSKVTPVTGKFPDFVKQQFGQLSGKNDPPAGMAKQYQGKASGSVYTWNPEKGTYVSEHSGVEKTVAHIQNGQYRVVQEGGNYLPAKSLADPEKAVQNLKYEGSGKQLGGAHEKYLFKDAADNQWLFKPALTLSGEKSPVMAHADELASKIAMIARPGAAIEVKAVELVVPGKGKMEGSVQKMVTDLASPKDFTGKTPDKYTGNEVKALQQEQVIDWLISNHDAHEGQFLRDAKGNVYGIDKTQAFKFFGKDKLDPTYHPNTMEKAPIYNKLWNAVMTGQQTFDPKDSLPVINKLQNMTTEQYQSILKPYATARFDNVVDASKFLTQADIRRQSLKSDFEAFYSKVIGKPFSFASTYSEKPNNISQEMHQTLEDAGYKFAKYGNKTGYPLYKDASGKAVYVSHPENNTFEYYPMGPSASATTVSQYGSSIGKGVSELTKVLSEPFEKPSDPSYVSKSSYNPVTKSLSTPHYATLDSKPYPDPVWDTKASPTSFVKMHEGQAYSSAEKKVISSYKGSPTDMNVWLSKLKDEDIKTGGGQFVHNVELLDSAVHKAATVKDIVVWRGVGNKYAEQVVSQYKVGDIHYPKSFQGTSTDQNVSHGSFSGQDKLVWRISVPKGTPAIATTEATTSYAHEKEIIFSRFVGYKIKEVYQSGGKIYMDVDLIHPKDKMSAMFSNNTLTVQEYSELMHAGVAAGLTPQQIEMGLTTATDEHGNDRTPLLFKLYYRKMVEQLARMGKKWNG